MIGPGWDARCLRCGRSGSPGVTGCPSCADDGFAVPVVPERTAPPGPFPVAVPPGTGAMWRWAPLLVPDADPVTLGEGGTPLTELPGRSELPGRVLLKDERANPTGSFKDRLASAALGRARACGAGTVALASSGNAGLAVAAYAAAAGLRGVLLATGDLPAPTADGVRALGTRLLLASPEDRWTALRTGAEELGWFPVTNVSDPPVASHTVGVHAYRTIAYEIVETLEGVPDWVVLPVSRGDALFGVWSGFAELAALGRTDRVPRMLAVERFPSLTGALADGLDRPRAVDAPGPVDAASIGDRHATWMALHTLRASAGDVVCCDDAALWAAWRRLAGRGVLAELSSAAVLCGAEALAARGELTSSTTAVLVLTAGPHAQATPAAVPGAPTSITDPTDAAALAAAVS